MRPNERTSFPLEMATICHMPNCRHRNDERQESNGKNLPTARFQTDTAVVLLDANPPTRIRHGSMLSSRIRSSQLAAWAETKPTIKALYVFGSRAKGTAEPDSDLDLAFDFVDGVDNELAELIENAADWKAEVTKLTGIQVNDVYLSGDPIVGPKRVLVFRR